MRAFLTRNIRHYVTKAYKSDYPCISKWHVEAGSGLSRCIERTVADFEKMATLKFYVVKEDGDFVGYFGTEFDGTYMPTIFVHPSYRGRKGEFWSLVSSKMDQDWKAGIYAKNVPCMKFYSRMGRKILEVDSPSGRVAVFQFNKNGVATSCH